MPFLFFFVYFMILKNKYMMIKKENDDVKTERYDTRKIWEDRSEKR